MHHLSHSSRRRHRHEAPSWQAEHAESRSLTMDRTRLTHSDEKHLTPFKIYLFGNGGIAQGAGFTRVSPQPLWRADQPQVSLPSTGSTYACTDTPANSRRTALPWSPTSWQSFFLPEQWESPRAAPCAGRIE